MTGKNISSGKAILANVEKLAVIIGITVASILFFKIVVSPDPRPWLREDGIIENIQAILFLAATIGFVLAIRYSKSLKEGPIWRYVPIVAWALLMFVFFGEEISWGQRIFDWQTPTSGVMATNVQNETNLHNLPTLHWINGELINYMLITIGIVLPVITLLPPVRWAVRFFAIPVVPLIYVPLFIGTYLLHSYQIFSYSDYGYDPREFSETMIALAFAMFAWHGATYPDSLFREDRT